MFACAMLSHAQGMKTKGRVRQQIRPKSTPAVYRTGMEKLIAGEEGPVIFSRRSPLSGDQIEGIRRRVRASEKAAASKRGNPISLAATKAQQARKEHGATTSPVQLQAGQQTGWKLSKDQGRDAAGSPVVRHTWTQSVPEITYHVHQPGMPIQTTLVFDAGEKKAAAETFPTRTLRPFTQITVPDGNGGFTTGTYLMPDANVTLP